MYDTDEQERQEYCDAIAQARSRELSKRKSAWRDDELSIKLDALRFTTLRLRQLRREYRASWGR